MSSKISDFKNILPFQAWANNRERWELHLIKSETLSSVWSSDKWDKFKNEFIAIHYKYKDVPIEIKVVEIDTPLGEDKRVHVEIYVHAPPTHGNPSRFCGISYETIALHPLTHPQKFIDDVDRIAVTFVRDGWVNGLMASYESDSATKHTKSKRK